MSPHAPLFFDKLSVIHLENLRIELKYPALRTLLESICRTLTEAEGVQFSDLFSRLTYLCKKNGMPGIKVYQIQSVRINANKVLHADFHPSVADYDYDIKALADTISHFHKVAIPEDLTKIILKEGRPRANTNRRGSRQKRTRVIVDHVTDEYILGVDEEYPSEDLIKIRYSVPHVNNQFNATVGILWPGAHINILNFTVESNGDYLPDYIVLEPDYLIDISAIAECYKEYGDHPLNYLFSKFNAIPNTHYLILGNIANTILDEIINEQPGKSLQFKEVLRKAFRESPFNISSCPNLPANFNKICEEHFIAIKNLVETSFMNEGINRDRVVLEPSFICESLGVQGRLDLMLEDHSRIVELKSGKAETYKVKFDHKENHYIQVLLYYSVLEFNVSYLKDRRAYLLYSQHNVLHSSSNFNSLTKSAINKRNLIVGNERHLAFGSNQDRMDLVRQLHHSTLITKSINDNFLNRFVLPELTSFYSSFSASTEVMIKYFQEFLGFIAKEHYLSKSGENSFERRGLSSLWLTTLKDKIESGDILIDLELRSQVDPKEEIQRLSLIIPTKGDDFIANFRKGDIVILYQRNSNKDSVLSQQVFKGTLEEIKPGSIVIRLRYRQRNISVLPSTSKYAVEHDYMDASFQSMYRGLYGLLNMGTHRQQLLLGDRAPFCDTSCELAYDHYNADMKRLLIKAKQAKDYFLLIGPPGTGKTSQALKAMIQEFHSSSQCQILVLAYTNRAVDEICETLEKIDNVATSYLRIGNELSTDKRFHNRLLDNLLVDCHSRDAVRSYINGHRVFVGTVTSLSGKMELFKLKHFNVAIIDEASQILEPQLFSLLSALDLDKKPAIDKFIMIGDHKQLPAVIIQSPESCQVQDEELRKRGFIDKGMSLFERLYHRHRLDEQSPFWDMLVDQGRMHPELADFPNINFYKGMLRSLGLPHQVGELPFSNYDKNNPIHYNLANNRLLFIPSKADLRTQNLKSNRHEAIIIRELINTIQGLCFLNNIRLNTDDHSTDKGLTIGIIVPYRNQIALIKKEIASLNSPELSSISIDTVERYQGSQRDIILYSFCVNRQSQLSQLSNIMVEDGNSIDRKLNVALTRARNQLIIIGEPNILSNDLVYKKLIDYIKSKNRYKEDLIFSVPGQ